MLRATTSAALLIVLCAVGADAAGDAASPFTTYVGGSGSDEVVGVVTDATGNIWVAGTTSSATLAGMEFDELIGDGGGVDLFVAKLNPDGTKNFLTRIGGSNSDRATDLAVDSAGRAHLVGFTDSSNFPASFRSYQEEFGGGLDSFVLRLEADGSDVDWATYFGGSGEDVGRSIAVAADGRVTIGGSTLSTDLPLAIAFQPQPGEDFAQLSSRSDGFMARFAADGRSLQLSSFVGGDGTDIVLDVAVGPDGDAYAVGVTAATDFPTVAAFQPNRAGSLFDGSTDCFVVRLDVEGGLVYSTYLGSAGFDAAQAVSVSGDGSAVVAGRTDNGKFPVVGAFQPAHGGATDAFVAKLSPNGLNLTFASYLGGAGDDEIRAVTLDTDGTIVVAGSTRSPLFPTGDGDTSGVIGGLDAFASRISADGGTLLDSVVTGGSDDDVFTCVAVAPCDLLVLGGSTGSTDVFTFNALQDSAGTGDEGLLVRTPQDPSAAPQITNISSGGSSVTLTWEDRSEDETGFEVLRSVDGAASQLIATLSANSTTYTDPSPPEGIQFAYRVRAVLPSGLRATSAAANVTRPPRSPSGVSTALVGPGRVRFTWSHDGQAADGFDIERAIGNPALAEFEPLTTLDSSTRTYEERIITPAGSDQRVTYRVRAFNGFGTSGFVSGAGVGPTGTFSMLIRNGRLKNDPNGTDRFTAKGIYEANGGVDLPFNPVTQSLTIEAGPAARPLEVVIPAGDLGWRVKRGKLEWTSKRSLRPPIDGRILLDLRRGKFTIDLRKVFLPGDVENPIVLTMLFGSDAGGDVATWKRSKRGRRFTIR